MRNLSILALWVGLLILLAAACSGGGSSGKRGSSVTALPCGFGLLGSLEGSGSALPDFTDTDAVSFFRISDIPPEVVALEISVTTTAGDADLHLGGAGTAPGSTRLSDYILSSQEVFPQNVDTIRVTLAGSESPTTSLTTPTLSDYLSANRGIPLAVWGVQPGTAFIIQVNCENSVALPCGLEVSASVPGSGAAPPDFGGGTEVHFFEVQTLPPAAGTVSILASTLTGDANLYIGMPGMTAPSSDPADYVFSSTASSASSANDLILIDSGGLHDVFGFTNPLITLQNYLSAGGTLWVAVAGLSDLNDYTLRVTCSPVDPILCGQVRGGTVNGTSQTPPDLANGMETRFFQLDRLPSTATSVTLTLQSNGDADLHLAGPGVLPGSAAPGDYIFSSTERNPSNQDSITIDLTGLQNAAGAMNPTVSINDYLQSAVPMGIAVAGYEDPFTNFSLSVSCVAPPLVMPISCGGATSLTLLGNGGGAPNLNNLVQNLWFEITSIPAGTNRIEIGISNQTGNVNLYLANPDVVPGSQILADYTRSSVNSFWPDRITVCDGGTASLFGIWTSPTLQDYVMSSENLSFVVAGIAVQTDFTVSVKCNTGPAQATPTLIDCGDLIQDQVGGSSQFPPDFDNPSEVKFFEIPLASVQAASSVVRFRIDPATGQDADLYLLRPGATPGSLCYADYIFRDISGGNVDWIRIRASGLDTSNGATSTAARLADYQAASTNLGFAVAGWVPTDFALDIICN